MSTQNEPITPEPEIREEYFENTPTDVEAEDEGSPGSEAKPWDPEKIRIHTSHYSLHQIIQMISESDIDLAPDFQRNYVWGDEQRWGLIESILLGVPLPSFYFNEDKSGKLQVVDGVQRLTTIKKFAAGEFSLSKMTYLKELEGKYYQPLHGNADTGLDPLFRRRFQKTQIVAHVIDPQTPYRVKFDVFKRINTGGSPLSAQEIRHCMSLARSRALLKRLVERPEFVEIMGLAVMKHPRMANREIALRLVAFHVIPVEEYGQYESLDAFLGAVTERIDRELTDAQLIEIEALAKSALHNAKIVFGPHAFRRWGPHETRKHPISRPLVESWGMALARRSPADVSRCAAALQVEARAMMAWGHEFHHCITGGTGDTYKVKTRLALAEQTVQRFIP